MFKPIVLVVLAIFGAAVASASAAIALSPLFGSNMVLQRAKPVPVTGTAAATKGISVTFNGQTKTTTSDASGNWQVTLDAMVAKATGGNFTATETGSNTLTLSNVVVGDVWICSGQSNMDMILGSCDRQVDIDSANFPVMREFRAPLVTSEVPLKTITASWTVCSPSTASGFSAVAFYFGRKICQDQSSAIPIGLYLSSVGGTKIDPWLNPEGASDIPVLAPLYGQSILPWGPFSLFNGMVYPYAPLAAKGLLWYQGENSEISSQSTDSYFLKMKALAQGYQRMSGMDDFAFYFVQLAYWGNLPTDATPVLISGGWDADTRIQQANAQALPHAGMASALDIGSSLMGDQVWDGWHPKDKLDVGERLALWALKNDYGRTITETSGPILRDVTIAGSTLVCSFDHIGSGLMVGSKAWYQPTQELAGGTLQKFSISGASGTWYDATATIVGNTVVVSSPSVALPRRVAYACWQNPVGCNLYNKQGLPASPFYMDDATAAGHFTITAQAGAGGSISPVGTSTYLKRATTLYSITPDAGSFIKDVKVDGVSVGSLKYYTFDPLYANHTIAATFDTAAPSYAIATTSTASGTISPAGPVNITQGGLQKFTMLPAAGCRLISTTVDGAPLGNRTSVFFADVRTPHALNAFFAVIPTPGTGTGLRGDYYIGTNFETFKLSRTDATVSFDWGIGSPDAAIPADGFTARWTGQLQPQFSETYKFFLNHDNGAKLWVNNQLLVNNWTGAGTDDTGSISLIAGTKYDIKLELLETSGNASCKLEWVSPSLPREVLPQSQLFPATTPIYTLTATPATNGSFSPGGAVLVNSGGSQTFNVVPSVGYFVADVKVDTVSLGALASYPFTNVTANHSITATFSALPSYAVSGKVANKTTAAAIAGAKVNFYTSANAMSTASYSATTDASGNYSINIPMGTWSITSSATNYFNSSTQLLTVSSAAASNINFALMDGTRNIPRISDLLFSVVTDSLPTSGSLSGWPTYQPSGQTLTNIGSPTVETIMGRKWEKNLYADGDGLLLGGSNVTAIACTGATIVLAVKPLRSGDAGNWRSLVDIFYDRLVLGITNDNGQVCVRRNGSVDFSGTSIPDGQVTILTLIVQTDGSYSVYANGSTTAILSGAATGSSSFIALTPGVAGGAGGYGSYINIGRNNPDGWTTSNGYIGDVFVYKTALSAAERMTIETDMQSKFIHGGVSTYTLNAAAGAGGTVTPAGSTYLNPGASQAYTITPTPGYGITDVTVDGVSQGVRTSYTFSNVQAPHTIAATFAATGNTPPTISAVADQNLSPSSSTAALPFTVGDAQTTVASLTVTATSSNTTLVPIANIVLGGSSANRTVTVTPVASLSGIATVTLTVNDGAISSSVTFLLTVGQPAAIVTHPASVSINSGGTTTLGVVASGTGPFTYQWYQGPSGTTATPVGTNSASFTTPPLVATTGYWVKVINAPNPSGANSNTATVTVIAPVIGLEQPAGTALISGSGTVNFGSCLTGLTVPLTFTLKNTGSVALTGIEVTKDGANNADYALTTAPAASVAAGDSCTFVVTFAPSAAGARTAALHLASNDATRNPFNISLSGAGVQAGKDILTFVFPGLPAPTIAGNNISLTVPYGTKVTSLAPTYTLSPGATCLEHVSGTAYDFTNQVSYTVRAADLTTKAYTVTVSVTPPYTYTIAGGAVALVNYTGTDSTVSIPPTINGLPVTSIADYAFASCYSLTSVTIPAGITSIGVAPFADCPGLTAITVDAANVNYCSVDGVLFDHAKTALIQYPGAKSGAYTLPATLTGIGDCAFYNCPNLTGVTLDESVTSIGASAFYLCPGLTGVILPASVTAIGDAAFGECNSLASARFMGNAPTMGYDIFLLAASGLTVQYYNNRIGFTTPTWKGYPSVNLGNAVAIIVVEQTAGTALTNGTGTVDFGSSLTGVSLPLAFTLKNTGPVALTGIAVTTDGPNATEYVLTTAPSISVAAGSSTTCVVTFTPAAAGARTAALHIASTSATNNPFTVNLTGSAPDMRQFALVLSNITNGQVTGAGSYLHDTTAQLNATPAPGYAFTGWSGDAAGSDNPLAVLMDTAKTITATFRLSNQFASWIQAFPGVGTATGFNDDPDGDGIPNGLENFLGTSPAQASAGLASIASTGSVLKFRHTRSNAVASDITAIYQWSTDLVNWFSSGQTNSQGVSATITS
ncbi:MAG: leucine-rich repeat protein, partial [Verrucomicrobia bacterium]